MVVDKKSQQVTLHDLELWGGQLALQIAEEGKKTRTDFKQQMADESKKITDHFDHKIEAWIENRAADLLGVKHDEIRMMQDKQKNHEERISSIEQRVA